MEKQDSSDEKNSQKTAYYTALLNTWVASRRDRDQAFLVISSGAVGWLISILVSQIFTYKWMAVLVGIPLLFFIGVILMVIHIFGLNSDYLEVVITKYLNEGNSQKAEEADKLSSRLQCYDKWCSRLFIAGVVASTAMGITVGAVNIIKDGGVRMAEEQKSERHAYGSVGGMNMLAPDSGQKESVAGIGNLAPTAANDSTGNGSSGIGGTQSGGSGEPTNSAGSNSQGTDGSLSENSSTGTKK